MTVILATASGVAPRILTRPGRRRLRSPLPPFLPPFLYEIKAKFYDLEAGTVNWEDDVRERISAQ